MKKLLLITSIISSLFATTALAKTEGHRLGIGLIKSDVVHKHSYDNNTPYEDTSYHGLELSYKHAFPLMNKIYVAPGVSYNRIGTNTNMTNSNFIGDRTSVDNRFSLRADIGYDINESSALYAVAGYSAIGYKVYDDRGDKRNDYDYAPLFGAGLNTEISKNLDLVLEYTNQHAALNTQEALQKVKMKLETYMVGVAYKF